MGNHSKKLSTTSTSLKRILFSRFVMIHLLILLLFVLCRLSVASASLVFRFFDINVEYEGQWQDLTRFLGFAFQVYLCVFLISIVQFRAGVRDRAAMVPVVAGCCMMIGAACLLFGLDL